MVRVVKENKDLEIRAMNFDSSNLNFDDNNMHVSGLVNKAGSKSQVISEDGIEFYETINPQAFIDAVNQTDHPIDFYEEHDPSLLLATTDNGSLVLNADPTGLSMEATMVDTQVARDAYQWIKTGIIKGMSFGFTVLDDSWDYSEEIPFRTVNAIELYEVSAVRFPAYLASDIEARGIKNLKEFKKRGFDAISNVKLKKEERNLDLSKVSDEDLKKEFEKRSLVKEKEARACKHDETRDDSGLSLDDASTLISSVFGDNFADNLVSQIIDSFNTQLGDFLNGSIDDGSGDEDRDSKQFNIVPVKQKQTRDDSEENEDRDSKQFNVVPVKTKQTRDDSDDDSDDDQQLETDSRSLEDFNNFLRKAETAEGDK